jgi:hypothetical protein
MAAVPLGWTKEYAILYMLASLANVDYPTDKFKIVLAISDRDDPESKEFLDRVRNLVTYANIPFETEVIFTHPSGQEEHDWDTYRWIIHNLKELRSICLNSDCDYMWILGGDNPPLRGALKRLLALNSDIASALNNQRPSKSWYNRKSFPLVYRHKWILKDLDKRCLHNGDVKPQYLNEVQKQELTKAWLNLGFLTAISDERNWRSHKILRNVIFGDGCCLINRKALEKIDYEVLHSYMSYDMMYAQRALAMGLSTAVDMKLVCPHLHYEGEAY